MAQYTPEEVERITYLALIQSPFTVNVDDAHAWALDRLDDMKVVGLLPDGDSGNERSSGRSERSGERDSSSRSGNRGRDRARQGNGFTIKDPDGPATKSQIGKLLSLTDEWTWEDAEHFTKGEISEQIDRLVKEQG